MPQLLVSCVSTPCFLCFNSLFLVSVPTVGMLFISSSYHSLIIFLNIQYLIFSLTNKDGPKLTEHVKSACIALTVAIFISLFLTSLAVMIDPLVKFSNPKIYLPIYSNNNSMLINWCVIMLLAFYPHLNADQIWRPITVKGSYHTVTNIIYPVKVYNFTINDLFVVPTLLSFHAQFQELPFHKVIMKVNLIFKHKRLTSIISKLDIIYSYYITLINLILIVIVTPSIVNPGPCKELSIAYCNIQGLIMMSSIRGMQPIFQTNKLLDFQNFVHMNKPDIVAVNESWLNEYIHSNEIIDENYYKMFRYDRSQADKTKFSKKGGGGVFILVKQGLDIETKLVNIPNPNTIPVLSIEIKFKDSSKLCFSTFYRYGYSMLDTFEAAQSYYCEVCRKYNKIVIVGDLNLSSVQDWEYPQSASDLENRYVELFHELGLGNVVHSPTHRGGNVLDLILTNQPGLVHNLSIDPDLICPSDHFSLTFKIKKNVARKKFTKQKLFKYGEADWAGLSKEIGAYNWTHLFNNKGIIEAWNIFKSKLDISMRKYIPLKTAKFRIQPPWFDSEIFGMSKIKHRLRKIYKDTGNDSDKENYDHYKSLFKQKVMDKKRAFISADPCSDPENDKQVNKNFWSFIKAGTKCSRIPEVVHYKGRYRSNKTDQCESFNKFFCDQFTEASSYSIPINLPTNVSPENFSFYDVYNFLRRVKPNKAPGPDAISGHVLKNCAIALSTPLTLLFNMSYSQGQLPPDWKTAHVVPIHKKGRKDDVENYRPISLTSLVMKIFEKCLRHVIYEKCRDLITTKQHGFMPERSCTTQMLAYIDHLAVNHNLKIETDVVYFDFAKAFDSVNHDTILSKLKQQYEIKGHLLRFIREYLKDRKQCVIIDGNFSSFSPVLSGVPQGSVLGPLLFVLFINDIVNEIDPDTNVLLYADDMKIYRQINSQLDRHTLQSDINSLEQWACTNKMRFHPGKCKVLHCRMQNQSPSNYCYTMAGTVIECSDGERDLGVVVVPTLKWNKQHRALLSKASQKLGLLRRNCSFSKNIFHRRTLYLCMVRSQFEHCSQIWRPVHSTHSDKFEGLQKRGIKWILNEDFVYYSKSQYYNNLKLLDILPLSLKFDLNDLVLFHRVFYMPTTYLELPTYLVQIQRPDPRTTRCTRSVTASDDLQFTCSVTPRVDTFKNSFFYRTFQKWNALPYEMRENGNPDTFKVELKEHLWRLAMEIDSD